MRYRVHAQTGHGLDAATNPQPLREVAPLRGSVSNLEAFFRYTGRVCRPGISDSKMDIGVPGRVHDSATDLQVLPATTNTIIPRNYWSFRTLQRLLRLP